MEEENPSAVGGQLPLDNPWGGSFEDLADLPGLSRSPSPSAFDLDEVLGPPRTPSPTLPINEGMVRNEGPMGPVSSPSWIDGPTTSMVGHSPTVTDLIDVRVLPGNGSERRTIVKKFKKNQLQDKYDKNNCEIRCS